MKKIREKLCVIQVLEDDGHFDPESVGRLYGSVTLEGDYVGFTGKYSADVFGRWYGPIQPPESKD
jgi:hypothetical protein